VVLRRGLRAEQREERLIVSTYWVRTGVVGLVACLAVGACDDNPVGEGRGDARGLSVNPDFAVVNAADSTRIEAVSRDRYRDLTYGQVSFTACDAIITLVPDTAHPTGRVDIEAPERIIIFGETLGESCVIASGPGGLSDTATVQVVPRLMEVTLQSVIGSGESATAVVEYFDEDGNPVTGLDASDLSFSVSDGSVADVDANGTVTGKAPGDAELTVALSSQWSATRSDDAAFTVEPGPFGGTVVPATVASWGETITITAAPETFDDDTEVTFDGLPPYVVSFDSTSEFVVVGPVGMGGSPSELLILDAGESQLAFVTTVEVTDPDPMDANEPNNDLPEATPRTLPVDEWVSVDEDLDRSDYFILNLAAETTINFNVDWNYPDADVDVYIYDSGGADTGLYGCATGDVPEACTHTLGAGTWYIEIYVWDGHGHGWLTTWFKMSQ
jgi:hypothetical protein